MRRYTVVLEPDAEEGGYVVRVPALPGCVTQGETVAEALENARDVIGLWLEELAARGQPIPDDDAGAPVLTVPALALVEVG